MATKYPKEITLDNIGNVTASINKAAKRIHRKLLIRKLCLIVGCLCFALLSLCIAVGTLYHFCEPSEQAAVDTIPVLGIFSLRIEQLLFPADRPVVWIWGMIAAGLYGIPLVVCIILAIVAAITSRPSPEVGATEEPARAHQLYDAVGSIYNKWLCLTDKSKFRIFCNYLFTVLTAGVFVLMALRVGGIGLDVATIIGAVVFFVLVHLVFKLLLGIFVGITSLLYRGKNPITQPLRTIVNEYLKKTDPDAFKEEPVAAAPASSGTIVPLDPFTWTVPYVQANEEKCGDTAMNYVEVAKEVLAEGKYSDAAAGFDRAAYALELLSRVPGGDKYKPYLFANQYAAARIYAFGLHDRSAAQFRLEQAVTNAGEYALKQYPGYESVVRDFKVMNGVLDEFNKGTSMSDLYEYYGTEFPGDILNG